MTKEQCNKPKTFNKAGRRDMTGDGLNFPTLKTLTKENN